MATSNDYERPGTGFLIFRDYENGEYIYRNQLDSLINYLAEENMARGKYEERICYTCLPEEGELVDLTEPFWKDHFKVCYRCNKLDAVKL